MTEISPLSVSEITEHIRAIVESDGALRRVYVRGELSNYKIYPSGHHYFTLKDAESSLRCVMFRSSAQSLRFRPASGMSVAAIGRIAGDQILKLMTLGLSAQQAEEKILEGFLR